ncbi:TetR/AcrR family transcriptional regulator [Neptunicella marina]|uniref:TetR/AcrR family transcriptional regulator n=1 Tax=Neptunicella marina TaxID=2125989 RepID=A0A8J6IW26_9ALTE|nr:TetR/AcrR family transcriptional regulator [Neptunicella marina]MBC3767194.1 TetR/AcrR family transcriptional regulator [Neptunicella marina]
MDKREQLVSVAQQLFYKQGITATGIDKILAQSGVSKRTLYNHFKSKDELIVAALQRRDKEFMTMLKTAVPRLLKQKYDGATHAGLWAYFDAIDEWINSDKFCGCMFINASAEFPRKSDPIHAICASHKMLVIQFIEQLLVPFQLADSHKVAVQMAILTDGAIVNAHTANQMDAAKLAKMSAQQLLHIYQQ